MRTITHLYCDDYVRTARRPNAPHTQTLDAAKHEITMAETPLGVTLTDEGGLFSLVPWSRVKQVVYAEPEPKAKA
jgi:hypothetical protein